MNFYHVGSRYLSASTRQKRLAIFALNPNPVHCQLFPSVHLQSAIRQVLNLFQSSGSEKRIQLLWFGKEMFMYFLLKKKHCVPLPMFNGLRETVFIYVF